MILKLNSRKRNNLYLYAMLGVYWLAGCFLLQWMTWYTDSPDTVFYLTISKKYADGNFFGAINNYWSPMMSWLLIPFRFARIDPMISFKLLQLALGTFAIVISSRLSSFFIQHRYIQQIFIASLVPLFLSYALAYSTPDLLFLTIALGMTDYLLHLHASWFSNHHIENTTNNTAIKQGIYAGFAGALLYFTKSFGFPYFLLSFSFFLIACMITGKKRVYTKRLLPFYLTGLLVFLALSFCWIGAMHYKYGSYSTGYASAYNFNLLAKERYTPGHSILKHPVLEGGLMNVNEHEEASAWESPGSAKIRTWSPFDNFSSFKHYMNIILYNWLSFYYFVISRNIGLVFLLTLALYFVSMRHAANKLPSAFHLSLGFMLILAGGYSLVFFMPRYLWLCYILMPLMIIQLLEKIIQEKKLLRWPAWCFIAITFFLLVKKPVKEILFRKDTSKTGAALVSAITHPFATLHASYQKSMQLPVLISKIKAAGATGGNVAGISTTEPAHYSYTQSLLLCMYLDQPFFGEVKPPVIQNDILRQLRHYNIHYLYAWEPVYEGIPGGKSILSDPVTGFSIIQLE
jgi:hypothetical protein